MKNKDLLEANDGDRKRNNNGDNGARLKITQRRYEMK